MKHLIVTIDGPAGAGKTTVSRMLAERLGYRYIDTGALYRGIAFEAKSAGVKSDDNDGLEALCRSLNLTFRQKKTGLRLYSGSLDITDRIRTPEMAMLASAVSARQVVREYLLDLQRALGRENDIVIEGRDMGTVVFPDAGVKFYLDAALDTRALRRYHELKQNTSQTLESVKNDIRNRDRDDSNRKLAPLKPAHDAIIIDSTDLSLEAVVDRMQTFVEMVRNRE